MYHTRFSWLSRPIVELLIIIIIITTALDGNLVMGSPSARILAQEPSPIGHYQDYDFVTHSRIKVHPALVSADRPSRRDYVPEKQDTFLLEMMAFNKTFCMRLHPNTDLLHPEFQAIEHYRDNKDDKLKTRSLDLGELKPYRGHVIAIADHNNENSKARYSCRWEHSSVPTYENVDSKQGWARFMIDEDMVYTKDLRKKSAIPVDDEMEYSAVAQYKGSFTDGRDIYSVGRADEYEKNRRDNDKPLILPRKRHPDHQYSEIIATRLSDKKSPLEKRGGLSLSSGSDQWCGSDSIKWNIDGSAEKFAAERAPEIKALFEGKSDQKPSLIELSKRSTVPAGCPATSKMLYMTAVADCSYVSKKGTVQNAKQIIIDIWNRVSAIYENQMNVNLGLKTFVGFAACGTYDFNKEASSSYNIRTRLSDFSKHRGDIGDSTTGLWHLMSDGQSGSTIGIAWMDQVCQTSAWAQNNDGTIEYVTGAGISTMGAGNGAENEFMVTAHEIGHNFGANHDCSDDCDSASCSGIICTTSSSKCVSCGNGPACDCDNNYIMASKKSSSQTDAFSPNTVNQMCSKLATSGSCLKTPGLYPILNTGCGNGILEEGEDCDTGAKNTTCCIGSTCTFQPGASCAPENHGCCNEATCQAVNTTKVCRPKLSDECDYEERCDGSSISCPEDKYIESGTKCSDPTGFDGDLTDRDKQELTCATGICTSRKIQCINVGEGKGTTGVSSPRYDIVGVCPGTTSLCRMFCQSQVEGCISVGGSYRLGLTCGNSGTCKEDGTCTNPDFLGLLFEWVYFNKALAGVVFGGIALLLLFVFYRVLQRMQARKRVDLVQQARLEARELALFEKIEREQRLMDRIKRQQMALSKSSTKSQDDKILRTASYSAANSRRSSFQ